MVTDSLNLVKKTCRVIVDSLTYKLGSLLES